MELLNAIMVMRHDNESRLGKCGDDCGEEVAVKQSFTVRTSVHSFNLFAHLME